MSEAASEREGDGLGGEMSNAIARRAYEISQADDAGTPEENWSRAESELGAPQEADQTQ
jgi:hypothetical protein